MSLSETVKRLQSILARLQHIDLWPPSDAAVTVALLITRAIEIAITPPRPDPVDLADTAAAWARAEGRWDEAVLDVRATGRATEESAWDGLAADAYRSSLKNTTTRFASVTEATTGVRRALHSCEAAMTTARSRHSRGIDQLRECARPLEFSPNPSQLVDELGERLESAVHAVHELIGSYTDAALAVEDCTVAVEGALDQVRLPRHLVDGMPAITQVNLRSAVGGAAQDSGPLRGSVAERAQAALDAMSSADRADVEKLLAAAGSADQRAWILAAVASGLTGAALSDFASKARGMSDRQLGALDPTTSSGSYIQPDGTTCGSSTLVLSRMVNDPAYAMWITTGHDPTGRLPETPDALATPTTDAINLATRFGSESRAMHDRTSTTWPEALGTYPTDVDIQMSKHPGGSGVSGVSYSTTIVDPESPDQTYNDILAAVSKGHTVPMYVYGIDAPSSGAHVTLVVAASGDDVTVYDPGDGIYKRMTRIEFNGGDVTGATTWPTPLSVSLPN